MSALSSSDMPAAICRNKNCNKRRKARKKERHCHVLATEQFMVTPGSSITLHLSGHNGTFSCRLTWAGVTSSRSNEIARHISSVSSAPLPSESAASNASRSASVPDSHRAKRHPRTWITSSAISGRRQLATNCPWNVYGTAHCTLITWVSIVTPG